MQTNEDQWELKTGNLRDMFIADWFHGAPIGFLGRCLLKSRIQNDTNDNGFLQQTLFFPQGLTLLSSLAKSNTSRSSRQGKQVESKAGFEPHPRMDTQQP